MDEAARHRLTLDDRGLARELGVPVVPAAARQGRGIPFLIQMVAQVATGQLACRPHRIQSGPPALKRAVQLLVDKLRTAFPDLPNARWVALRLLEGDARMENAVRSGELADLMKCGLVPELERPSERVG
jgi:ferrous iron transport protein B